MSNLPTFDLSKVPRPKNSLEPSNGFRMELNRKEHALEIAILDVIGEDMWGGGVTDAEVKAALDKDPSAPVSVAINSPGGLFFSGLSIYNLLAGHQGEVTTINQGLAFSAASVIFLAGDKRKVYASSQYGIHRVQGGAWGTAQMVMDEAVWIEQLDKMAVELYVSRTGQSADQINAWLDGTTQGLLGTRFDGEETIDAGFATEVIEPATNTAENAPLAAVNERSKKAAIPLAIQARRQMIDTLTANR